MARLLLIASSSMNGFGAENISMAKSLESTRDEKSPMEGSERWDGMVLDDVDDEVSNDEEEEAGSEKSDDDEDEDEEENEVNK